MSEVPLDSTRRHQRQSPSQSCVLEVHTCNELVSDIPFWKAFLANQIYYTNDFGCLCRTILAAFAVVRPRRPHLSRGGLVFKAHRLVYTCVSLNSRLESNNTRPSSLQSCVRDVHTWRDREFIDNLLVRIHCIIVMVRWTGLAPWEFEFPFPGSRVSTLTAPAVTRRDSSSSSSSLTFNLLKGDHLLTTHRSPSIWNRAPLQTS